MKISKIKYSERKGDNNKKKQKIKEGLNNKTKLRCNYTQISCIVNSASLSGQFTIDIQWKQIDRQILGYLDRKKTQDGNKDILKSFRTK